MDICSVFWRIGKMDGSIAHGQWSAFPPPSKRPETIDLRIDSGAVEDSKGRLW